jgi:hypothetical protein
MEPLGFYNTKAWADFRTAALERAGYQCEAEPTHDLDGHPVRCRQTRRLHVHHEHGVPIGLQEGLVFCPAHHREYELWLADSMAA